MSTSVREASIGVGSGGVVLLTDIDERPGALDNGKVSFAITNHGYEIAYIGSESVTPSTGTPLNPGAVMSVDLSYGVDLFAICDTGVPGTDLRVLQIV